MKQLSMILAIAALLFGTNLLLADATGVDDAQLDLSKESVFDTPEPAVTIYPKTMPGSGDVLPRSWDTAPPQIPHNVEAFIPVTRNNNQCMGCHNNPAMWGKKVKGLATPIPPTHYTSTDQAPGKSANQLSGARYICTQCHMPQADAPPLVENTFGQ
jgi:cytochrome c-type protein NapB